MKVLLLGAGGMLAHDLLATAPGDVTVLGRTYDELDVTDAPALERALDDLRPDVVVNAAAYTAVDRAETERELAFRVNGEAVGTLGTLAAARGVRVVHFSTDYVFAGDGTAPYGVAHPTAPLNAYGESKLAGETALLESGARAIVVRTQWLFGRHGHSFPRTMLGRAVRGQPTRVVADQTGSPTYSVDLARATWTLLAADGVGLFHVANAGATTWHELARRVFAAAGRPELLSPCTTADYPTPARRPSYSVLDTSRYEELAGAPLPSWEDAVDRFLADLRAHEPEAFAP